MPKKNQLASTNATSQLLTDCNELLDKLFVAQRKSELKNAIGTCTERGEI